MRNNSFSFCHEVIVLGQSDEYQVRCTFVTTMVKDFVMTTELPPYKDMVASLLIRTISGQLDHYTSVYEYKIGVLKIWARYRFIKRNNA